MMNPGHREVAIRQLGRREAGGINQTMTVIRDTMGCGVGFRFNISFFLTHALHETALVLGFFFFFFENCYCYIIANIRCFRHVLHLSPLLDFRTNLLLADVLSSLALLSMHPARIYTRVTLSTAEEGRSASLLFSSFLSIFCICNCFVYTQDSRFMYTRSVNR